MICVVLYPTFKITMGRKKRENTVVVSVRIPERIANILNNAAFDHCRNRNDQMWAILETWLIENGYIDEKDRKRKPIQ